MFTGIVAARGQIVSCKPLTEGQGRRLRVQAGSLELDDVAIGDSIAIQGACMTVIELEPGQALFLESGAIGTCHAASIPQGWLTPGYCGVKLRLLATRPDRLWRRVSPSVTGTSARLIFATVT